MEIIEQENNKQENLKVINKMQAELAKKFYGFFSTEKMLEWIDAHSANFREIVKSHPDFVERFEKEDVQVLDEIEHELYHDARVEKL